MKVVTPLVVALFTAAVAAVRAAQEDNYSKNCSCITTFMELEESLLKRHSNMDNLHQAFFPSNQQFPVAVDLVVHFSTSLRTTSSQGLSNPSITRLDNNTSFDYKFRWSASTVIHFVRQEVLSFFSLFVYQGTVTTAEVVIDPICRGEKTKPEQLLNSLCVQLESYALNRAAKVDKALTGYCLYYKYHTDLKTLGLSTEDVGLLQQVFFVTAVIFLCLIIAIRIPAALYVVPVNKSPTTPPKSGDNSTSTINEVDSSLRGFEASTVTDKLGKKMLNKISESNYTHYFFAIFAIAPFLNIGIILLNVCALNMYKLTWQIVGFSTAIIVFSAFGMISISVLACRNKEKFKNWNTLACISYGVGVFSVVLALQLLSFHGTFILLAFTFSPLLTVSFTFIYISALFSLLGVVGTVIKVVCKWYKDKIQGKQFHYVFQIITDMISFLCVLSFDALIIILMRYQVRHNHFGLSGFFGALLPTAVVALIGFGGGKLIGLAQDKSLPSTPGGNYEVHCNPGVESTLTAETTAAQPQQPSPSQQSFPQTPIHDVATNPTTKSPAQVEPSSSSSAVAVAMDEPARNVSVTATGNKPQAPESSRQK